MWVTEDDIAPVQAPAQTRTITEADIAPPVGARTITEDDIAPSPIDVDVSAPLQLRAPMAPTLADSEAATRARILSTAKDLALTPVRGAVQMATGAKHLVTGEGGRLPAGSDVFEGALKVASPALLSGAVLAPEALAAGMITGSAATEGVAGALRKYTHASPELQRFAGDVAGLLAGGLGGEAPRAEVPPADIAAMRPESTAVPESAPVSAAPRVITEADIAPPATAPAPASIEPAAPATAAPRDITEADIASGGEPAAPLPEAVAQPEEPAYVRNLDHPDYPAWRQRVNDLVARREADVRSGRLGGDVVEALNTPAGPEPAADIEPAGELHGGLGAVDPSKVLDALPPDVKASAQEIGGLVTPASGSEGALRVADLVREAKAKIANANILEAAKNVANLRHFRFKSEADNIANISHFERTGKFFDAPEGYSELYKESGEQGRKLLQAAYGLRDRSGDVVEQLRGGDAGETEARVRPYIENYVRRAFEFGSRVDEERGTQVLLGQVKRSLSGNKSPTKARVLDMPLDEALDDMKARGIKVKLATSDPERLRQWSLANARQAAVYRELWDTLGTQGHIQYVRSGARAPEGMVPLEDRVATIFKSPQIPVSEFYDKGSMDALKQVMQNVGITADRPMSMKSLGLAYPALAKVRARFATPEDVLAHEIGHVLDHKYGLAGRMRNDPMLDDLTPELRRLADLRYEGMQVTPGFKGYVRSMPEKIATMFQAYMHMPTRMKEVAPNAYHFVDFLIDEHPELSPLRTAQRGSLLFERRDASVYAGGHVIAGRYYADPTVAHVLGRAISKGLGDSPTYRGIRRMSNAMNSVQLGLSGFHYATTALNSVLTDVTSAIGTLGRAAARQPGGDVGRGVAGLARGASILGSFVRDLNAGRSIWTGLKVGAPEALDFLEHKLSPAGGRLKMDDSYRVQAREKFLDALSRRDVGKAALHLPGTLVESLFNPISHALMEHVVPLVKLGAFSHMAADIERRLPEASADQLRHEFGKAWDSVDNRFGQLVYDNLFWNNTAKAVGQVAVRSVGWNVGTLRELGGGVADAARGRMTDRAIYSLVALPTTVAFFNGLYQYALTGQRPTGMDFMAPRNGEKDASGNDVRVTLFGAARDAYSWATHPLRTAGHKTGPLVNLGVSLLGNQDFWGDMIWNPTDTRGQKLEQVGSYLLKELRPFSVDSAIRLASEDNATPVKWASSFLGAMPAPPELVKSDAQLRAEQLLDLRGGAPTGLTPEQREVSDLKRKARDEIHKGGASPSLQELVARGAFANRASLQDFIKSARLTPFEREVHSLSKTDRADVLSRMNGGR